MTRFFSFIFLPFHLPRRLRHFASRSSPGIARDRATAGGTKTVLVDKFLIAVLAAALIGGCATAPKRPPVPETARLFNHSFDKVWAATVAELSGSWPFQLVEKDSGLIETQMVGFGPGFSGWTRLENFSIPPRLLLATWSGGARGRMSILIVSQEGGSTSVRLKGHFEGFENNVANAWYVWQSTGVLEGQILDRIAARLDSRPSS